MMHLILVESFILQLKTCFPVGKKNQDLRIKIASLGFCNMERISFSEKMWAGVEYLCKALPDHSLWWVL